MSTSGCHFDLRDAGKGCGGGGGGGGVSIPCLRTLWTLCQAKTAKRGKTTREDFIA